VIVAILVRGGGGVCASKEDAALQNTSAKEKMQRVWDLVIVSSSFLRWLMISQADWFVLQQLSTIGES
jgi:hypothetical protein